MGSAEERRATRLPAKSYPPTPWLSSTNCSGVICPASRAASPYWTPTLSSGLRAKPVLGSRPSWFTICSAAEHLTPFGLVTGSQRADTGIELSQLPVAVTRLAKVASHETHEW